MTIYWRNFNTGFCRFECKKRCKVKITKDSEGFPNGIYVNGKNAGERVSRHFGDESKVTFNGRQTRNNEYIYYRLDNNESIIHVNTNKNGHTHRIIFFNDNKNSKYIRSKGFG